MGEREEENEDVYAKCMEVEFRKSEGWLEFISQLICHEFLKKPLRYPLTHLCSPLMLDFTATQ